jgi:hypothetical protein
MCQIGGVAAKGQGRWHGRRETHLDQVGVPRISGDSKVIIALLLQWVLVSWSCPRGTGFKEYLSRRTPEDVALSGFPTVSGEAIRTQITVYSRYFEERTNRPDMIDAEDRESQKGSTKS